LISLNQIFKTRVDNLKVENLMETLIINTH